MLSRNFSSEEFECPGNNDVTFIAKDLVSKLQFIREVLGMPLKINEAFRTSEYQQELRDQGYQTSKGISQHQLGRAADISLRGMDDYIKARLIKIVESEFRAIGYANTFLHVDLREDKRRSWSY